VGKKPQGGCLGGGAKFLFFVGGFLHFFLFFYNSSIVREYNTQPILHFFLEILICIIGITPDRAKDERGTFASFPRYNWP